MNTTISPSIVAFEEVKEPELSYMLRETKEDDGTYAILVREQEEMQEAIHLSELALKQHLSSLKEQQQTEIALDERIAVSILEQDLRGAEQLAMDEAIAFSLQNTF